MLQTSLLLTKSLNKTETPIFESVVRSLFLKAISLYILYRISQFSLCVFSCYSLKFSDFPYTVSFIFYNQGPVVQSVVSLTSSLRVISLTILANSIYNILIFFAEKCE